MIALRDNVVSLEEYKAKKREKILSDFIMDMLKSSGSLLEVLREESDESEMGAEKILYFQRKD